MFFPYTGDALLIFDKAFPYDDYTVNRVYQNPFGRYVYVNSRGYLHSLSPCKIKTNGQTIGYEVLDYVLKKDGSLRYSGRFSGPFGSKEDAASSIINLFG